MTIKRVEKAAEIRGMYFDGEKKWRNNTVGYGYEIWLPFGGFVQSDSLNGMYKAIRKYPVIRKTR